MEEAVQAASGGAKRDPVGDFVKYLQHERGFSPHTVKAYLRDVRSFFALVYPGEEVVDALGRVDVRAVRAWVMDAVSRGLAPRTVNRHLASLNHFFEYLEPRGWSGRNPVRGVVRVRAGRRVPQALRVEEAKELFDGVDFGEDYGGVRDRTLLLALYTLGVRRSELVGLTWSDVGFVSLLVKVCGKGGRERLVPMTGELAEALRHYRGLSGEQFGSDLPAQVFLTNRGQPVTGGFVYRLSRRYLGQVTTQSRRGPHLLRHTYATHLLAGGADIVSIKELLGHSSLVSTQVYAHVDVAQLLLAYREAHPRAHEEAGSAGEGLTTKKGEEL